MRNHRRACATDRPAKEPSTPLLEQWRRSHQSALPAGQPCTGPRPPASRREGFDNTASIARGLKTRPPAQTAPFPTPVPVRTSLHSPPHLRLHPMYPPPWRLSPRIRGRLATTSRSHSRITSSLPVNHTNAHCTCVPPQCRSLYYHTSTPSAWLQGYPKHLTISQSTYPVRPLRLKNVPRSIMKGVSLSTSQRRSSPLRSYARLRTPSLKNRQSCRRRPSTCQLAYTCIPSSETATHIVEEAGVAAQLLDLPHSKQHQSLEQGRVLAHAGRDHGRRNPSCCFFQVLQGRDKFVQG